MSNDPIPRQQRLIELAGLFSKVGCIAFGGPPAHIAILEHEVVRRRKWLSREEFLDLLGATNLIPGPNSTEIAIHIGHRRGGWQKRGLGDAKGAAHLTMFPIFGGSIFAAVATPAPSSV